MWVRMVRFALALLVTLAFALNPIATASAQAHCPMIKVMAAASHETPSMGSPAAPMKGDPCQDHQGKANCAQACATHCAPTAALAPYDYVPAVFPAARPAALARLGAPPGSSP